eukprot:3642761-Amphidinium_carterae.1
MGCRTWHNSLTYRQQASLCIFIGCLSGLLLFKDSLGTQTSKYIVRLRLLNGWHPSIVPPVLSIGSYGYGDPYVERNGAGETASLANNRCRCYSLLTLHVPLSTEKPQSVAIPGWLRHVEATQRVKPELNGIATFIIGSATRNLIARR